MNSSLQTTTFTQCPGQRPGHACIRIEVNTGKVKCDDETGCHDGVFETPPACGVVPTAVHVNAKCNSLQALADDKIPSSNSAVPCVE